MDNPQKSYSLNDALGCGDTKSFKGKLSDIPVKFRELQFFGEPGREYSKEQLGLCRSCGGEDWENHPGTLRRSWAGEIVEEELDFYSCRTCNYKFMDQVIIDTVLGSKEDLKDEEVDSDDIV